MELEDLLQRAALLWALFYKEGAYNIREDSVGQRGHFEPTFDLWR